MQGDEQEPDMRCGTLGTSGHVTTKSSICKRGVLYKSGVHASRVTCLTLGDLPCALERRVRGELAEGGALEVKIDPKEIDPKEGEDGRYREKFKRDEKNLHDVQTLQ